MHNITLHVTGIANTEMKTALKNALDKIEGVATVDIDKTLGSVDVGFNAPADEYQIRDRIEDTGFHLT